MINGELSARVFISCGQRSDGSEAATAAAVSKVLAGAGFIPYIAVNHQSLKSIRENVYPQLRDCEYFLFLDFRREAFFGGEPLEYRGSLFSHQELAIASFLNKSVLAFQEGGLRPLDGLLGHLQTNCISFSDRSTLPARVAEEVSKRGWRCDWQNRLSLSIASPAFDDALQLPSSVMGRFFHIRVSNLHEVNTAEDCVAYLRKVVACGTGKPVPFETVEFKWAGYGWPYATIAPSSSRRLDAFWLSHDHPTLPNFNCFADSTRFIPRFEGVGDWDLTFEVLSPTVPGAEKRFRVELRRELGEVRMIELT